MRKYILLFVFTALLLTSCNKKDTSTYVTVSGKVVNPQGSNIMIRNQTYSKTIKMNDDGTFKDTLHLTNKGKRYGFSDGKAGAVLYLKNGDDINITVDTQKFYESISFTGKGAVSNNYLKDKTLMSKKMVSQSIFDLEADEFDASVENIKNEYSKFIDNAKGVDADLIALEKEELTKMDQYFKTSYKQRIAQKAAQKNQYVDLIGKPAPQFTNFENFKGGKTSLKDLRGKYVYIDVWATWCRPCLGEIPHLQKLEEEFHNKNIAFVSISVDKANKHDAWKKMISDKKMGGIQLFANGDSSFDKAFKINSIPRFILIDPKGNVVEAEAPRPSSPKTKALFQKLLK